MSMKENSAYLKGLLEGVSLDPNTAEGKVITALCNVIEKMASEIDELHEKLDTANAYIEELDEDLGYVEDLLYNDEDGCGCEDCGCEDEEDDECDCCCDHEEDEEEEDGEEEDDEDGFLCVMCPNCGDTIYIEDSVDPSDVVCPSCQKPLVSDEDDELGEV